MSSSCKHTISDLRPVHIRNDNNKDKDKDNYISVHTSGRYRLFILSARSSTSLNFRARDNRIDYDCLSIFLSFISWKKNVLKVIPTISFLCAFIIIVVVWTLLFFNTENNFYNYIFMVIFIVIMPGVNRPLEKLFLTGFCISLRCFSVVFLCKYRHIWLMCLTCSASFMKRHFKNVALKLK